MSKIDRWTQATAGSERAVEGLMAAVESWIVSSGGRVGVWLTPIPSAVLVSLAAANIFDLKGTIWPVLMAISIEFVGLMTGNLWLEFKEWNATKNKTDPEANIWLARILFVFYFVITGIMILTFELTRIFGGEATWGRLTGVLFPILSAVAIIGLNARIVHNRRKNEKLMKKFQRQGSLSTPTKTAGPVSQSGGGRVSVDEQYDEILRLLSERAGITITGMANEIGMHRNTVGSRVKELEERGVIGKNGNGRYKIL